MPASSDPARVRSVFDSAVGIGDPDERAAYLAAACADDHPLRQRVDALLRANDGRDSVLDGPLVIPPPDPDGMTVSHVEDVTRTADAAPDGGFGFDLGEELGRGGAGVVHRAVQHGLNRVVAVKTLLADTDAMIRRN